MLKLNVLFGLYIVTAITLAYGPLTFVHYIIMALMTLLVASNYRLVRINASIACLLAFVVFTLISALLSDYIELSIFSWAYFTISLFPIILISSSVSSISSLRKIIFSSFIGMFLLMIFSIFHVGNTYRFEGVVGQSNLMGLACSTSIVYSLIYMFYFNPSKFKKTLIYLSLLLSTLFLFMTESRGAIISLVAFSFPLAIVYFSKSNMLNKVAIVVFSIFCMLTVFNFVPDSLIYRIQGLSNMFGLTNYSLPVEVRMSEDGTRLELIHLALSIFSDNPLLGVGLGVFRNYSDFVYTHSNFFDILYGSGLLGSISFHLIYIIFIYEARKIYKKGAITKMQYSICWGIVLFHLSTTFTIPYLSSKTQIGVIVFIMLFSKVYNNEICKENNKI